MVYRGKPSAGCENCRKAKKRCGLEQPACLRCVKLRKTCSGYRDTTQLQIQDESESVRRKANRPKRRSPSLKPPKIEDGTQSPLLPSALAVATPHSEFSAVTDAGNEASPDRYERQMINFDASWNPPSASSTTSSSTPWAEVPIPLLPKADEIAISYFFDQFTAPSGHWTFLRDHDSRVPRDPLLDYSMRACGMAALHNVQGVVMGREYARSVYGEAIGLLNKALRDPKMCKLDSTLIAVAMLGYYENLICDSSDSVRSWKAHISGAMQLLKLRGKSQFKSAVGRMLYREIRAQVLINCVWDDLEPPSFLVDWDQELQKQSPNWSLSGAPPDRLAVIVFDFATLKAQMRVRTTETIDALRRANDIQNRMIQWSMNTMSYGEAWQFSDLKVNDSPHVWNGIVHSYCSPPAAGVWNLWRSVRIMITRVQEVLCKEIGLNQQDLKERVTNLRNVRRQMTDEICCGVPSQLGHAAPALNSPCVLITAYGSIWPLTFAATCALERLGYDVWDGFLQASRGKTPETNTSAAAAQAAWLIGRIKYIGSNVGLRWANGFAAVLRGDFKIHQELLPSNPDWIEKLDNSGKHPKIHLEREQDSMLDAIERYREKNLIRINPAPEEAATNGAPQT